MADNSSQLVLAGLSHAAAAGPVPLHSSRSAPGLFPASAPGRQAARRCQEEGWLAPEGALYTLTETGLRHLLTEMNPRQVLEDFVRIIESRQSQVDQLLSLAGQMRASLASLESHTRAALNCLRDPGEGPLNALFRQFTTDAAPEVPDLGPRLMKILRAYHETHTSRDCPLPDLFRLLQGEAPGVTPGQFHDALRSLEEAGALYLHPWTAPLYEVPEPSFALLSGHEVAYYASPRPDPV